VQKTVLLSDKGFKPKFTLEKGKLAFGLKEPLPYAITFYADSIVPQPQMSVLREPTELTSF
jgi:hypothetical protein